VHITSRRLLLFEYLEMDKCIYDMALLTAVCVVVVNLILPNIVELAVRSFHTFGGERHFETKKYDLYTEVSLDGSWKIRLTDETFREELVWLERLLICCWR
jgi:hypothetical protein